MTKRNHGKVMMRLMGALLAAVLMTGPAFAEGNNELFTQFDGIRWEFCSGAGGWATELEILPDGTFSGDYHDSEMGETADEYPDGSLYLCTFSGKLSLVEQVDEKTWKIRVDELKQEQTIGEESIEDGVRYVYTEPYGITQGEEYMLYKPGTSLELFTDGMKFWAHAFEGGDSVPTELQNWFFYDEKNDCGFTGYQIGSSLSYGNPWENVTADRLQEETGLAFTLPEGTEKVAYRWYGAEMLAEIQFSWKGAEYCFRTQPMQLKSGELMDISGMYFDWTNEEQIRVHLCSGSIAQAESGTGDKVERCLWYDETAEIMYSLSVVGADLNGLDLSAIAEQICAPTVG